MIYNQMNWEELSIFLEEQGYTPEYEGRYYVSYVEGEYHGVSFYKDRITNVYQDACLYALDYRRELTVEEIKEFLSNPKKNQTPWFIDWEKETLATYEDDLEGLNKHIWKTYRKRQRYTREHFSTIVNKGLLKNYTVNTLQGSSLVINTTKTLYFANTQEEYLVEDALDRHLLYKGYTVGSGYYTLLQICNEEFIECDNHPGEWYGLGGYCRECADQYKLHSFSENVLNHLMRHTGKGKIYYGVELEVDTSIAQVKPTYQSLNNFIICKKDGSIGGFEIVTAPATFDVHQDKWKKFDWEKQYITNRDGMHVHIDRKALNDSQIGRMFELIYNSDNKELVNKVAGRDVSWNTYCSTGTSHSLMTNISDVGDRLVRRTTTNRYTALNLTTKGTLEVRIFQAPSTYARFMANLEFVDALVKYTKPGVVSIKDVKKAEHFLNFLDRATFPNLCDVLFGARKTKETYSCA